MAQATGTATGTGTRQQSDGGDELAVTTPTDDENLFINPTDGLPNEHPALPSAYDSDSESNAVADDDLLDDLPTSIIVTNIHSEVFADDSRWMDSSFSCRDLQLPCLIGTPPKLQKSYWFWKAELPTRL